MADDSIDRLADIDPVAADMVRAGTAARMRDVSRLAVRWAIEAGGPPPGTVLDAARTALAAGRFGESAERAALAGLVEHLDEAAWDIQDQVDEGTAAYDEYSLAFRRARAVHCLWYALDDDPLEAAGQALYEAWAAAASDDVADLRRLVDAASRSRRPEGDG